MSQTRQLAAIIFTDIVGYTALMGEDEQKAFELLRKNRELQQALIKRYNGTWIKELGDGVLASFHTVTDAVLCAGAIQHACANIPDLKLRIGIHLGEVVFENNDVFGDSVNIASRLQALAPVNGIWISESVHKNIYNKKGISSQFVKEETLKNVKDPVQIYEVQIENFDPEQFRQQAAEMEVDDDSRQINIELPTKKEKAVVNKKPGTTQNTSPLRKRRIIGWTAVIFVLAIAGLLFIPRWIKIQKARNEWIPEIQKMAEANFLPPTRAFDLAKEAEKYVPNDSALLKLWPQISWAHSIQTDPADADVYWKDYNDINGDWKFIGKTPLKNVGIPRGFPRIKIEKSGFETVYNPGIFFPSDLKLKLDSIGKYPENMVKVSGSTSHMLIVGLEKYGGEQEKGIYVNEFLVDKYEVTNKDFKKFVDSGGYNNKKYWDYPVYSEGKEIPWEKAMELFHDKTGKHGPADWEVGAYPDGKDNYPVTGISWYEATAYAKFVSKILPTVYHWSLIANTWSTWQIIPRSNFNSKGTVPVGSLDGINWWGTYDVGGNVREWCSNETDKKGSHYILGGGWNDPGYAYNDAFSQPGLDRSLSNGFRCMKQLPGDTSFNSLSGILKQDFRDYKTEKPVDDKIFNIFLRQYDYDHSPLNPDLTSIFDTSICKIEKIDFDAAYNKERMAAYFFLPKNVSPPYQTIVVFPGSNVIDLRKFDYRGELRWIDFILRSGRAVCYPVLKGTFERGDGLRSDLPDESVVYRNHVINWVQDISRSLDYLETRKDIAHNGFGYFGVSWGSAEGPIVCAIEKRIKAAVFHVGGLCMENSLPEVDVFNFLPRVTIPVLMLNGKNDTFFPLETSQKPMFNLLGTDEKDKKIRVYDGGHFVPRSELIKESLSWYDKYLGAVK